MENAAKVANAIKRLQNVSKALHLHEHKMRNFSAIIFHGMLLAWDGCSFVDNAKKKWHGADLPMYVLGD
jgi:hypothetical protein